MYDDKSNSIIMCGRGWSVTHLLLHVLQVLIQRVGLDDLDQVLHGVHYLHLFDHITNNNRDRVKGT
jgi:hypothetical protein